MIKPPRTAASLAGYAGAAFLLGVAAHSIQPYAATDMLALSVASGLAVVLIIVGRKSPWLLTAGICLLALVLGLWRFELARPDLPRNLIPFSNKGLAYTIQPKSYASPYDPRHWLLQSRQALTAKAHEILPPDEAALLTGILYGERGLSKTTNSDFRRAGMLHIIAVSGSNVTVVVTLVMPLLLAFGLARRRAFVVLTAALLAFVLFVFPGASVVRAAVMGWLIELAPLLGRVPRTSRLLLIAAVVFCAWQPWALFFDASFGLSFLAMWGLLAWTPRFVEWLRRPVPWTWVRQILAASMGATLMTTPYSAWAFGQVTVFSLITSLLALPLLPWIMVTGALALLLPHIQFLVWPAQGFLKVLLLIAKLPDLVSWGVWNNLSTNFFVMSGWYVLILTFWLLLKPKKRLIHNIPKENS